MNQAYFYYSRVVEFKCIRVVRLSAVGKRRKIRDEIRHNVRFSLTARLLADVIMKLVMHERNTVWTVPYMVGQHC